MEVKQDTTPRFPTSDQGLKHKHFLTCPSRVEVIITNKNSQIIKFSVDQHSHIIVTQYTH